MAVPCDRHLFQLPGIVSTFIFRCVGVCVVGGLTSPASGPPGRQEGGGDHSLY